MKSIPFFYYFLVFISFQALEGLSHTILRGGDNFSPLWPIFWTGNLGYQMVATSIILLFLGTTLMGAFFYKKRFARIIAFIGILQYHSFLNSFGGPNHQYDLWLWVSFILIFLPDVWNKKSEEKDKLFLLIFRGVQAFILLTYSMSGIGKIYGGIKQLLAGSPSIFSLDAAALHTSSLLNYMREITPLANFVVSYPVLSWTLFIAVIYLEVFSIVIVFRPSLHRIWALFLILFHLGTYLTMRAIFVQPVALLLIFFFESPFQIKKPLREIMSDFPVVGLFKKFFYSRG